MTDFPMVSVGVTFTLTTVRLEETPEELAELHAKLNRILSREFLLDSIVIESVEWI